VDVLLGKQVGSYAGILLVGDALAAMVLTSFEELCLLGFPSAVIYRLRKNS
jgi:hypothetical protein